MYVKRAPSYSEVFPQRYSESSALIINLKKIFLVALQSNTAQGERERERQLDSVLPYELATELLIKVSWQKLYCWQCERKNPA